MKNSLTWITCVALALACACAAEEPGFSSLFNGKDLTGWDGDPRFWSVTNGVIRGQTTTENKPDHNTFLVWRDGTIRDFELKIRFRIEGENNSGVQYRSKEVERWRIHGYQAEIINKNRVGFLWNEGLKRKGVQVGQRAVYSEAGEKQIVGKIGDHKAWWEAGNCKPTDWSELHIIARGRRVQHLVNGELVVEFVDHDLEKSALEGLLALQVHGGGPLLVEFKDIRLKPLGATKQS